jgi:Arylsulfotransferase (ASST)
VTVPSVELTRSRFIALGGAACAGLLGLRVPPAVGSSRLALEPAPGARSYFSRPDLKPPAITVTLPADRTAKGNIFLAPFDISAAATGSGDPPVSRRQSGPLVVDDAGEPIWFLPLAKKTAMNVRVQRYRGRHVLTWYEGTVLGPYGGEFVVYDATYHQIARVRAGRGRHGDLHDFVLTEKGTALITIYHEVAADLTSIGGARDGRLVNGIVQEVDVASGKVLFEWRSREHVGLAESYMTDVTPAGNVDYFHLNAVALDHDGHLLISARNTSAVYKIHRRTGRVMWRLGGKMSTFRVDPAASFSFQHDAHRHADGTITVFDNAASGPGTDVASRAIRISLDLKRKRASLVRQYVAGPRDGWAMGNAQQLDDGGLFVGWGTDGSFSEFGPGGKLRFDARFADGSVSYRAFRWSWAARPTGRPALAVMPGADGTTTVYVSWNGATEVAKWRVETGRRPDRLAPVTTRRRTGFETAITLPATTGYVSGVALDAKGNKLGAAIPVAV